MMRKLKYLATIITIIAGIIAILSFYYQIFEKETKIEIKNISTDKLTNIPDVKGLKANYTFYNRPIKNLWKLVYSITNVGDNTIVGEGNNKNIIKDKLIFKFPENYKILEIKFDEKQFPFKAIKDTNFFTIKFQQWRPNEGYIVSAYVEQRNNENIPKLTTNDRDILNGNVIYSSNEKTANSQKKPIAEYIPEIPRKILWWFTFLIYGFVLIMLPIGFFVELNKNIKFKKWKKEAILLYEEWLEELIKNNKIDKKVPPEKLPKYLWYEYPYVAPTIPDNFNNLLLGVAIGFILIITPLLYLIKI